jgi:hypothetical protein
MGPDSPPANQRWGGPNRMGRERWAPHPHEKPDMISGQIDELHHCDSSLAAGQWLPKPLTRVRIPAIASRQIAQIIPFLLIIWIVKAGKRDILWIIGNERKI